MPEKIKQTISADWIESLMAQAEMSEYRPSDHSLILSAQFPHAGGFVIVGENACLPTTPFDVGLGRKYAIASIRNQLWAFEAYRHACDAQTVKLEGCLLTIESDSVEGSGYAVDG